MGTNVIAVLLGIIAVAIIVVYRIVFTRRKKLFRQELIEQFVLPNEKTNDPEEREDDR